ncbi:GYX1 [Auxenochlorella protothecoides x Auxenochlorella symbiontica]|uniref:FMN hydroxy acid dehydrogenase domain-containing protein n=1 Tax=Auxenochlorella protothecoides TaxID=3075 RepID=A0A1D2AEB4_AUXPR
MSSPAQPSKPWTSVDELEEQAVPHLPASIAGYYLGHSERGVTVRDNVTAFTRWRLLPRCMVDVSTVNTSCTILGSNLLMPILIAPMAMQRMCHPDGELAVARAAASVGSGMILSTMSTAPLADVAEELPSSTHALKWFQVYVLSRRDVTAHMVKEAEAAGYTAIVVTVDAPRLGKRDIDDKLHFDIPPHLSLANLKALQEEAGRPASGHSQGSGFAAYFTSLIDPSLTWDCIAWLKSVTRLPILVKGVLAPDDARAAIRAGSDGIVVSNHGGRQLDGTPSALDVLPHVAAAVAGRVPILMDGGVRRGTDVLKCLALGASAVLIGRPVLWGLTLGGEEGVRAVLSTMRAELELSMALLGVASVQGLNRDYLVPPMGGGLVLPAARM